MSFLSEWALAVHRAIWFPFFWAAGLEGAPVDVHMFEDATADTRPGSAAKARRRISVGASSVALPKQRKQVSQPNGRRA